MIIVHVHHTIAYQVDAEGRCEWHNCTSNVYDSFDEPEQTFTDQDIQAYRNVELSDEEARMWISNGLTAEQARPWLVKGYRHPGIIARHIRNGRTSADFAPVGDLA